MEQLNKSLIVVKIGTSSLTWDNGEIHTDKIKNIVRQVAALKKEGHHVIIVTSGSIAAGFRQLGYRERPKTIPAKQACAAVGQGILMEEYNKAFLEYGHVCAQILLTRGDFTDKRRYQNIFNSLLILLKKSAVPIINENDTISIEELKFGDNDTLSARVAALVHADLLVLLTDIDGLYTADPKIDTQARRIDVVEEITPQIEALAGSATNSNAIGGMKSKLSAAHISVMAGVPVLICSSQEEDSIIKAANGTVQGTYFKAAANNLNTKLQWMAFYSPSKGIIYIDEGAVDALKNKGKSLLPSGIVTIEGKFEANDVVKVRDLCGNDIGKGICNYSCTDLERIKGLKSAEIENLGKLRIDASLDKYHTQKPKTEVIHRDNWISLKKLNGTNEG